MNSIKQLEELLEGMTPIDKELFTLIVVDDIVNRIKDALK